MVVTVETVAELACAMPETSTKSQPRVTMMTANSRWVMFLNICDSSFVIADCISIIPPKNSRKKAIEKVFFITSDVMMK